MTEATHLIPSHHELGGVLLVQSLSMEPTGTLRALGPQPRPGLQSRPTRVVTREPQEQSDPIEPAFPAIPPALPRRKGTTRLGQPHKAAAPARVVQSMRGLAPKRIRPATSGAPAPVPVPGPSRPRPAVVAWAGLLPRVLPANPAPGRIQETSAHQALSGFPDVPLLGGSAAMDLLHPKDRIARWLGALRPDPAHLEEAMLGSAHPIIESVPAPPRRPCADPKRRN